ncbi:MAG: RNA polymerase sigma factor [Bacteroidetes bacterium]|nr:RNA polymerase sigma factor [Bacteroidota bacterium]MCB0843451.1 RNA polymerase sigma factor [Bacteroidota bacterium]
MTNIEFNTAVANLQPSLMPIAFKFTRDEENARDLLQETLLKAFRNKDKFRDGTNLKAWLYTIMRNTFITHYHRVIRHNTFTDPTEDQHFLNATTKSVKNDAYSTLAMEEITEAVEGLSYVYQTPFMMYYLGYKYHEIADILEIPIGTVKNRIHIARKQLKSQLKSLVN